MPCKVFAPVLEELSGEMAGKVDFYKVNVDDNNALAVQYSVASIPTVILFQNGAEAARIVGVQAKEKVRALIEQHL